MKNFMYINVSLGNEILLLVSSFRGSVWEFYQH